MMFCSHTHQLHRDECQNHGDWNGNDRNNRTAEIPQEDHDHDADNDQFFNQSVPEVIHCPVDQLGSVIGCHQFDAGRKS
jgi:hypothetical protein